MKIILCAECPFAITPSGEPHELRLTVNTCTVKENSRIQTINSNNQAANAIIITNSTKKPLNNSMCNISSLEVYRGREQAIEISHQGFSLGDSGSIQVYKLLLLNFKCMSNRQFPCRST